MTTRQLLLAVEGRNARTERQALRGWLASEDALRGRVRPRRAAPEPGQMGSTVELLTVALGSGGVGAVLIQGMCTWLTTRRSDVTVTVTAPDGRETTVDVKRAADPWAVVREVLGRLSPDAPSADEESG